MASGDRPTLVLPQHPTSRIDEYVQIAQDGLKRPPWGDGLPSPQFADGNWRTHLCPEGATPEQALALVHSTLFRADVQPTEIGYEETLEGVRRIVWDQSWPQPWWSSAPRAYLSREQAQIIVASLLAELPTATADAIRSRRGPVRGSLLPMYPLLPHVPLQRGPMQDAAMVGLHSAAPLAFRLLGMETHWLATSVGGVHYLDTGPPSYPAEVGAPPLLLVHGLHTTSVCWAVLAAELAPRHRVLVPDLLDYDYGFSRSSDDADRRRAGLAQHVQSCADLAIAVGGTIDLVGHSYGGAVAAGLARTRPLLVRRLALLCPYGAKLHDPIVHWRNPPALAEMLEAPSPLMRAAARLAAGYLLNAQGSLLKRRPSWWRSS